MNFKRWEIRFTVYDGMGWEQSVCLSYGVGDLFVDLQSYLPSYCAFCDNINGLNSDLRGPWGLSLACFISPIGSSHAPRVCMCIVRSILIHTFHARPYHWIPFLLCIHFIFHAAYRISLDVLRPLLHMQPFRHGEEDYASPGPRPHLDVITSIYRFFDKENFKLLANQVHRVGGTDKEEPIRTVSRARLTAYRNRPDNPSDHVGGFKKVASRITRGYWGCQKTKL